MKLTMIEINTHSIKFKFILWASIFAVLAYLSITTAPKPDKISTQNPIISPIPTISKNNLPTPTSIPAYLQKQAIDQTAIDKSIGELTAAVIKEKPFVTKLPIITSKYVLVYDWDKNAIRVRLSSKNITPAEVEIEIRQKLSIIGVPFEMPLDYLY